MPGWCLSKQSFFPAQVCTGLPAYCVTGYCDAGYCDPSYCDTSYCDKTLIVTVIKLTKGPSCPDNYLIMYLSVIMTLLPGPNRVTITGKPCIANYHVTAMNLTMALNSVPGTWSPRGFRRSGRRAADRGWARSGCCPPWNRCGTRRRRR